MLELNVEQQGKVVHFLDLRIQATSHSFNPFRTSIFDKRTNPKFVALPMTKYPHITSFLPRRYTLNIVLCECYRFARRCMSKKSFVFNVAKLLLELQRKGFKLKPLLRKALHFFTTVSPLYNCYSPYELHKHVRKRLKLLTKTGFSLTDPHLPSKIA